MFDVGDPSRNAILNICFFAIALLTVAAVVPWKALGAERLSKLARWLGVPVLLLASWSVERQYCGRRLRVRDERIPVIGAKQLVSVAGR